MLPIRHLTFHKRAGDWCYRDGGLLRGLRAWKRVGFAASPCAEIAGAPVSEISGPFSTDDIASNCVPALPLNEPILWIVSYTLMSVCGIILLILIVLLLLPFRCRHLPRDPEVVNDESSLVRHRWK